VNARTRRLVRSSLRWLRDAMRAPFEKTIPQWSVAALPLRARRQIRTFQARCALPFLGRPRYGRVDLARGYTVYVHADTLAIDVVTLDYVWREEVFPVELADRVVLDIGAHKGYFGALAISAGARAVISYEPEAVNFGALLKATGSGRSPADWTRHRCAVGGSAGHVALSVSSESWSHSIHTPASGTVLRTERVPMTAFSDVLEEAEDRYPHEQIVLKLNVEGAAGDCLLSVPPVMLERLEVLLVDLEANTPQPLDEILAHAAAAGFELVGEREHVYHFVNRKRTTV
jgi:FkbM family methyltransferase